jgi:hypothetical protein
MLLELERPGYLGKKRDEVYALWDSKYGSGKWTLAYRWGEQILSPKEGIQIYEDAYYEYLKDSVILDGLLADAYDIFDTAPSNVLSKFDYDKQETPNNHIHDIAIRRSVLRLGKFFKGKNLIQVRGEGTKGACFSPYMIPFHLPELIVPGEIKDYGNKGPWWIKKGIPNSVEEFYQQNKILVLKNQLI